MNAMLLERVAPVQTHPLVPRDLPAPQPGPGQVRLRVRCCAVCRTDLHIIEGELPAHKMPVVPGHQIVGVVDRLGPGCKRFAVGRRVGVAWLRGTDGSCEYCRSGRENLCPAQQFTGYDADGGYARFAVVNEDFAYEIPDGFDDLQAAPLLCAGIVGYRALKRANLPDGGRLAMYGFGSSANVIAQIAMARGCSSTWSREARTIGDLPWKWAPDGPVRLPPTCLPSPTARSSSPRRGAASRRPWKN